MTVADGQLKIMDFGLARTEHRETDSLTQYVQTRWWRAPEVIANNSYNDRSVIERV